MKAYLSGGIHALDWEEAVAYRKTMHEKLLLSGIVPVDPMRGKKKNTKYYSAEIVLRDLKDILNCDLVLADLNGNRMCGTWMEVFFAKERNIPVIAYCDPKNEEVWKTAHSYWATHCITRLFNSLEEAVDYILSFWGEK